MLRRLLAPSSYAPSQCGKTRFTAMTVITARTPMAARFSGRAESIFLSTTMSCRRFASSGNGRGKRGSSRRVSSVKQPPEEFSGPSMAPIVTSSPNPTVQMTTPSSDEPAPAMEVPAPSAVSQATNGTHSAQEGSNQQHSAPSATETPRKRSYKRTSRSAKGSATEVQGAAAGPASPVTVKSVSPPDPVVKGAQLYSIPEMIPPPNDECIFSDDAGEELPRAFKESTLVYNALTGRMTSETSLSITCLRSIGFGVNAERQVYVERPEQLNELAARMRSGQAVLPKNWPVSVIRSLGAILRNCSISNPAEAIQQMMQIKINNITRSRYASVVSSSSDASISEGSAEAFNLDDELADPTKAIELNDEQENVIRLAMRGHNMYIGGSAGTGKTVLLRVLSRRLQAHRLRVAMTATTGVAGCHIGGSTFHHALGVSSNGDFLRRSTILDYDAIIVDEVSMFPQFLFEEFDRVLREEAGTPDLPFGGVQIILCGDFLQLGCINESSILKSKLFQDNFVKLRLEKQVRQISQSKFAADLQQMRIGIVPSDLSDTVQQLPSGTMVESAVNLLPTNKEVHVANERELARLKGDPLTLTPETGITSLKCEATATLLLRTKADFNEVEFSKHVRSLLQATLDLPRASLLSLYRVYEDGHAMRVILPPGESIAWRDAMRERFLEIAGLINDLELGATVTEIVPNADGLHTAESEEYLQKLMAKHPIAQPLTFKTGCRVLLRANLNANLVNGSIGTVVDFVECKRENFPEFLRCERVDHSIDRYRVFCVTECGMPVPMVPVVQFHSGETIAVPPWEFSVGGGPSTQYYSLSSVALPLTLAYAFTVHKVQGLTLVGRVHLELSRMWPCEHLLYVAMSRVRNPEQLSMSSFAPAMVVANKDCVEFDRQLKTVDNLSDAAMSSMVVSSWKRCNDTIYHLRRRGASLRHLLQGVTMGNNNGTHPALVTGLGSSSMRNIAETTSASAAFRADEIAGEQEDANIKHLATIEHSVLVARRMRKLVKHAERISKLREGNRKEKRKPSVVQALQVNVVSKEQGILAEEQSF